MEGEVFTRKSSGLIRVMSPFSAFVYNVLTMGLIFPWVYLQAPAAFPGSSLWLGIIICTILQTFLAVTFAFLASAMPRSGGDYIFQSRILGGWIGHTSVLSGFVIWILQWVALSGWLFASLGLGPMFVALGVKSNTMALLKFGLWCQGPAGNIVITLALAGFTAAFLCSGFKHYVQVQWFLFAAVIIAFILVLIELAATKSSAFMAKFNDFTNNLAVMQGEQGNINNYQNIINEVTATGFNIKPKFSFLATLGVIPIVWMSLMWCSYSVQQGSEIKSGSSLKSQIWIIVVSLWVTGILLALQGYFFQKSVTQEWLVAISAEYYGYAAVKTYSLGSLTPFPSTLVMLLSNPVVIILIGIGYMANAWQVTNNCYIGMTRDIVAMSLDKTLPDWLSRVHPKLHTPVNAHLAYFLASIPWILAYNLVPVWFDWTLGVSFAGAYVFLLTALSGVLFPYKAPSIFKASPAAKYGKLIVFTGAVGFVFTLCIVISFLAVPNLGLSFFIPGGWKPALLVIGIILFSLGCYLLSKEYYSKRGVDISLAFKEIPPE